MSQAEKEALLQRLASAREELAQAQAAMPAHSVRPWQMERLENAEEEVAELEARLEELDNT